MECTGKVIISAVKSHKCDNWSANELRSYNAVKMVNFVVLKFYLTEDAACPWTKTTN